MIKLKTNSKRDVLEVSIRRIRVGWMRPRNLSRNGAWDVAVIFAGGQGFGYYPSSYEPEAEAWYRAWKEQCQLREVVR